MTKTNISNNAFLNGLDNFSKTEKDATGFKSTRNPFVDATYLVASFRESEDFSKIDHLFEEMINFCMILAYKWLFWIGDIRKGLGERRLFRHLFAKYGRDELVEFLPEYHRWDFVAELDFKKFPTATNLIKGQWFEDLQDLEDGNSISLLGKWLPSTNASSLKSKELSKKIRKLLGLKEEDYRRKLSLLRGKINIVEKLICSGKWDEVNYESVPSKANLLYKDAFLKNDFERRTEFLKKLSEGKVQIKSSVNYPHEVVKKYFFQDSDSLKKRDEALEGLWKGLIAKEVPNNIIVVRDGSGSMTWSGMSNLKPMYVADALTLYFAERAKGDLHNVFLTFSSDCEFIRLESESLHDRLEELREHDDCSTTRLESVFDLLLKTAVENNLKQEDIPDLLVISDMEFDRAVSDSEETLMRTMSNRWERKGYKLPRLIFWNVASRSGTIPMIKNYNGLILISGYSQNVLDVILEGGDVTDSWTPIKRVLESERYAPIQVTE